MSKIKINQNQFIGKAEYSRLMSFLQNDGIDRKFLLNSNSFGLFEDFFLPEFGQILKKDCFYVRKAGTPYDQVIIQKGVAVDKDAQIIYNDKDVNIEVPPDNQWYWVKLNHSFSNKEKGRVSIDKFGNLTGIGTEFTKILRGQPNFPTKIKLINSLNQNVYEYEVVKVISDTNCTLMGDFNLESNLEFSIVGTFTPGALVPASDKNIYEFDSCKITLIKETNIGSPPNFISYKDFFLARVRNNGLDVTLQDKRIEWYKTNLSNKMENLDRVSVNPLIGVESIKYDAQTSTKDKNIVELSFGFRTSSYTVDTSSKKISILIGNGGRYKSTSDFLSSKFNGWRIYWKNGKWSEIIDSQKSGSQIVLTLDTLIPDYVGTSDNLFIAPPYEGIEIKSYIPNIKNSIRIDSFSINTQLCRFRLNSFSGCVKYNMTYRYKTVLGYTQWLNLQADDVGYYTEQSFDTDGELKLEVSDRVRYPYTDNGSGIGFINICEHPNSFNNFQNLITTGDLFGVNTTSLENSKPQIKLFVGSDKKYQHFKGQITLSADVFIVLGKKKADNSNLRDGNEFILHLEQIINLNGFSLRIVENFVDPTNYTQLASINANDVAFIKNNFGNNQNQSNGLLIKATFNELGGWVIHYVSDVTPKGTIRMVNSVLLGSFVANNGVKKGYWGWRLMDEMNESFPMGTSNLNTSGQNPINGFGGSNMKTIDIINMPPHNHAGSIAAGPYIGDGLPGGGGFKGGGNPFTERPVTIKTQGGGQPFDIRPSYRTFAYLEKTV